LEKGGNANGKSNKSSRSVTHQRANIAAQFKKTLLYQEKPPKDLTLGEVMLHD
jgi:hypothetical protein